MKFLLVGLLGLFLVSVLASSQGPYQAPVGITTSSTSISTTSQQLNSTTKTQKATYNPAALSGAHQDLGKFSMSTSPLAFSWNVSKSDSLSMGLPSLRGIGLQNSLVYYNSTYTVWQLLSGLSVINVEFKPSGYSSGIFIKANLQSPSQFCLPFTSPNPIVQETGASQPGGIVGPLPIIAAGTENFNWQDISALDSPVWNPQSNSLCLSLPAGITIIDPLALDGSGQEGGVDCNTTCTSTPNTLTTASSPDVIIFNVQTYCTGCGGNIVVNSVSDTAGLTWHFRGAQSTGNLGSNTYERVEEWYAVASGTLSGDLVTAHLASHSTFTGIAEYGISGADTSTIFDPHSGLPATATGAYASVSTSNTNDMIIGFAVFQSTSVPNAGSGFTKIWGNAFTGGEYQVVSATQSGLSVAFSAASSDANAAIGDAICQASCTSTTVTQPIQILLGEIGPSYPTITLSGCSPSPNSTFTTANVHTYTLTASCSVTLSNPAATTYTRYKFNTSPHPNPSASLTFTTCASGTCSKYLNTTYYQVQNNFTEKASKWDGRYDNQPLPNLIPPGFNDLTGTYLGLVITATSSTDLCYVNANIQGYAETFEGLTYGRCESSESGLVGYVWSDYGTGCWPAKIGNSWTLQTACQTPTTGNNVYTGNYVQSTGGSSTYQSSSFDWMLLLPVALLAFIVGKKL